MTLQNASKIFLGLFLLSTSAFAMPSVGDVAEYDATVTTSQGGPYPGVFTQKLTEFNASTQQFHLVRTVNFGQAQSSEEWVGVGQLVSDQLVSGVLAQCPQNGGTLETVSVPAGTFSTCAVPYDDAQSKGMLWVGAATFGIIKSQNYDKKSQQQSNLSLKSYHPGQ